jgi:hypothetical protein
MLKLRRKVSSDQKTTTWRTTRTAVVNVSNQPGVKVSGMRISAGISQLPAIATPRDSHDPVDLLAGRRMMNSTAVRQRMSDETAW